MDAIQEYYYIDVMRPVDEMIVVFISECTSPYKNKGLHAQDFAEPDCRVVVYHILTLTREATSTLKQVTKVCSLGVADPLPQATPRLQSMHCTCSVTSVTVPYLVPVTILCSYLV